MKVTSDDGVDKDLALAMALEEDEDSDGDFQVSTSWRNQALALRSCKAVTKHVKKKRGGGGPLRLDQRQRGGGRGDGAQLENETVMKVHCDERREGFIGLEDLGLKGGETGKRVLKDRNSRRGEIMESVVTSAVVVVKGNENGTKVRVGEVKKFSLGLGENRRRESSKLRIDSSLACDQSQQQQQQGQSGYVMKFDSKRKTESGWSLYSDGRKKVKTIAGDVEEDVDQTEGNVGVESLRFEGDGGIIKSDLAAEVDEDMIICTQVEEAPIEPELGQSEVELEVGMGKKTAEDRLRRRHNIYDILLGNNRTNRVPTCVLNSTVDKAPEDDGGVEEVVETLGTALRALIDEADLAYEGLDFDETEAESMDAVERPACGTDFIDLSDSDEEEHISVCVENCSVPYPGDGLGCEADVIEATENAQQLSSQRTVTIEAMDCPVCGVCIEELSTAEREEHTNACLEKGCAPCVRTNPGDYLGCQPETAGISQLRTSGGSVIAETLVCPVCGDCIEELSTAQREEHTNACLDKIKGEGPGEVAEPAKADLVQPQGRPDVDPVVAWLENLNLGKYVDIFVKEEIDWDTLKWLTEEDLSSLGITALGPRRKIVCAIQELRQPAPALQRIVDMREDQRPPDPVVISSVDTLQGPKKSIADFFIPPPNTGPKAPKACPKAPGTSNTAGGLVRNLGQRGPVPAGGNLRSARTSDIPTWMCIPGTSFRVDAFKYTTGNCSNWFLSHFHTDHYQGLTRGFRYGRIFCSSITARLVNLRIGIPSDHIQALPLNETVLIDGVRVTFIDANHCPGSVMILFEPPNGKAVLHTGDFRFCSDMICNEVLKACRISTLILDTTYCDPQYDFPEQDSVVQFVIDAIQAEAFNNKTLFLIGTYTIGKERIFLEVGKALRKYVYVGTAKQRLLDCMDLAEDDRRWLTTKDQESHIHVVPLWSVASFKRMGSISRHYHGRYNSIVAFSPTGWSFGKDKKRIHGRPGRRYQQGSIIRYEVPYSEHCSFTELKEFVRTIAPENIVPSVISSTGLTADAMVASLLSEGSCS